MQLHPRESFTITHQLNNPAYITDTAYVQAVIRNAKTDTILATKNLTDKGTGRFTVEYKVPADPSGQGFWISIITTVYSDSGYTTQSQNYGVEANTYLVLDRFNQNIGGVGGGGADIDYKRIRKMIDEAVDKVVKEIPEPKIVTVTKEVVKEVKVPEVKVVETKTPVDLTSVISAISSLGKKIEEKSVVPEPKEVDLKPLTARMDHFTKGVDSSIEEIKKGINTLSGTIKERVKSSLKDMLVQLDAEPQPPQKEVKKEEEVDPRVTKIMKKPQ